MMDRGDYRLVERTLVTSEVLSVEHHLGILAVLRRPAPPAGDVDYPLTIELRGDPRAETALEYVRARGIGHDIHDRFRWTGGNGR